MYDRSCREDPEGVALQGFISHLAATRPISNQLLNERILRWGNQTTRRGATRLLGVSIHFVEQPDTRFAAH